MADRERVQWQEVTEELRARMEREIACALISDPRVHATSERLQAEITAFVNRTPEEQLADAVDGWKRQVDLMNAAPLERRIAFLADMWGYEESEVEIAVSDVVFEVIESCVEFPLGGMKANAHLFRPVEQVWFTAVIEERPKADA